MSRPAGPLKQEDMAEKSAREEKDRSAFRTGPKKLFYYNCQDGW